MTDHHSEMGFFITPKNVPSIHQDIMVSSTMRRKLFSTSSSEFDWTVAYDSIDNTLSQWRHDANILVMIFIFSFSISLAVSILLALHTYLLLSAQTTLEFFMSFPIRRKLRSDGRKYYSPYNRGYLVNIKQVFGYRLPWYVSMVVPSCVEPVPQAVPPTGSGSSSGLSHSTAVSPAMIKPIVEMV